MTGSDKETFYCETCEEDKPVGEWAHKDEPRCLDCYCLAADMEYEAMKEEEG